MATQELNRFIPSQEEKALREWVIKIVEDGKRRRNSLCSEMKDWHTALSRKTKADWKKRFGQSIEPMARSSFERFIGSKKRAGQMPLEPWKLFLLREFLSSNTDFEQYRPPSAFVITEAKITSPKDLSRVPMRPEIEGYNCSVDPDMNLWLVVEIGNGCLYPQSPVTKRPGAWSKVVSIGRQIEGMDVGGRYILHLVLVPDEPHFQYSRYIRQQHECTDGMGPIWPAGVQKLQKITLVRGPL